LERYALCLQKLPRILSTKIDLTLVAALKSQLSHRMPLNAGVVTGTWNGGGSPFRSGELSMTNLKETLEDKKKMVDQKATTYRTTRDEWNSKTKNHLATRNEFNAEVRELIQNVKQQREIREQMNDIVREKKAIRADANKSVKEIKARLDELRGPKVQPVPESKGRGRRNRKPETVHTLRRDADRLEREFEMGRHTGSNEKKVMERIKRIRAKIKEMVSSEDDNEDLKAVRAEMKAAMEQQEAAHEEVQKAALAAQEAHELMLQWNKEVDRQRELAESSHRDLRRSKKEADKAHHHYIVSLRCLHSIQDILRAMHGASKGEAPRSKSRVEVQDLMGKLMSGETLTTEELMQLQRSD